MRLHRMRTRTLRMPVFRSELFEHFYNIVRLNRSHEFSAPSFIQKIVLPTRKKKSDSARTVQDDFLTVITLYFGLQIV